MLPSPVAVAPSPLPVKSARPLTQAIFVVPNSDTLPDASDKEGAGEVEISLIGGILGFEYGLCGKCLSRYDIAIGGGWVGWMGDEGDFSGDDIGGFCMGIGRGQIAARASGFVVVRVKLS